VNKDVGEQGNVDNEIFHSARKLLVWKIHEPQQAYSPVFFDKAIYSQVPPV
jgi:hypothetical protein